MIPSGKWLFLWQLKNVAGGNPAAMAAAAVDLGLTGVSIKVAGGPGNYNLRWNGVRWVDDIIEPAVRAFRDAGILVNGWHYIFGNNPTSEALCILNQIQRLNLDGLDVDAEGEMKGKPGPARIYMQTVRDNVPRGFQIGLTSYRFPTLHPEFPWSEFTRRIDYHLPQVYWNPPNPRYPNWGPVPELNRSIRELRALKDLPIVPAGRAYVGDGHPNPTPGELTDFMTRAQAIQLPGFSFWSFDHLYLHPGGKARADAIRSFPWPGGEPPTPPPFQGTWHRVNVPERYIRDAPNNITGIILKTLHKNDLVLILDIVPGIPGHYGRVVSYIKSGVEIRLNGYIYMNNLVRV